MQNKPKGAFTRYLMGGTGLAMLAAMSLTVPVAAQEAAAEDDITEVIVVGARAAQQSSNDRKKRGKTAQDSIVADDVGAFPDKNLNEALSRIAGVALERDDFGDGASITIRGNSAENIRVEMDGMGVGGGGMGATRAAELTVLPADMIKSVDVIKGSTADMTEGGLGGSVRVQTRTGLDFKKPYLSFRVGQRYNSLGQDWQPDFNLVASRKFFDNRLGVIFSVTSTNLQNTTNGVENNQSGAGYYPRLDFDNSPEKTFEFNPSTVFSPAGENRPTLGADTLLANSSFTPRQIVEMSAAAKTKDECRAAFPLYTPGTGAGQSNSTGVRNQRNFELQNCLNQWNDLMPSLPRTFDHTQYESRFSADLRFDFRVNDKLTVFAKYQINNREVDRYFRERRLGGGGGTAGITFNPGAQYNATTNPTGKWFLENTGTDNQQRRVAPGNTDYFRYETVGNFGNRTVFGDIVPIDPDSVVVDENHFVTEYVANDQSMMIGERWEPFSYKTNFMQVGGDYRDDRLRVEFMAGKSNTDYQRIGTNSNRSFNYGSARFFIQPSGLWATEILTPYDETNPANYVQMIPQGPAAEVLPSDAAPNYYNRAYTGPQRPLVSTSASVEYDGWLSETEETTAKIDATYDFREKLPFFTGFKTGLNFRENSGSFWSRPGGKVIRSSSGGLPYLTQADPNYTGTGTPPQVPVRDVNGVPVANPDYVAPIVLPRAFIRSSIRACEPTSTSIESCNYGYQPDHLIAESRDGVLTVTQAELLDIFANSFKQPESEFFAGYEGAEALENWISVDTKKMIGLMPNANMDCMKTCVASDGKVYEQPFSSVNEKVTAAYYMVEFEQELPFNLLIDGNFGLRVVETEVNGTGNLTTEFIKKTATYNPALPAATGGTTRIILNQTTSISDKTRDYLPSYNFNFWAIPDQLVVRYYKGKNVSRPPIGNLLPNGSCTIDERRETDDVGFEGDNGCGRIGNPGLKPQTAWNQNLSIEWYPNRDTSISFAKFEQDERIGTIIGTTVSDTLLAGKGIVDPITGESLDDVVFSIPTWGNAPGYKREGWEVSSKTAFTFLPWRLRYTGMDFNYSTVESKLSGGGEAVVDPNTGEVMPPYGEPKYFANLSLWYDDGKTNARITAQKKAEIFNAIEGNSGNVRNNYPFPGGTNSRPVVYNPGNPVFTEETLYIDAKITHKITSQVEIFAEARNITKEARISSSGGRLPFADGTPYVNGLFYGGRSFAIGVTYRMQ